MPYKMKKTDGGYRVTSPHGVKAKNTSKENAEAQMRLLRGIDHGWKPTGRAKGGKVKPSGCEAKPL